MIPFVVRYLLRFFYRIALRAIIIPKTGGFVYRKLTAEKPAKAGRQGVGAARPMSSLDRLRRFSGRVFCPGREGSFRFLPVSKQHATV